MTDAQIEAAARAMCERSIRVNRRWDTPNLTDERVLAGVEYAWREDIDSARAALAAAEAVDGLPEDRVILPADFVEIEIWQGDMPVAEVEGAPDDALKEARHYAAIYGQDGPVEAKLVIRAPLDLSTGRLRSLPAPPEGER